MEGINRSSYKLRRINHQLTTKKSHNVFWYIPRRARLQPKKLGSASNGTNFFFRQVVRVGVGIASPNSIRQVDTDQAKLESNSSRPARGFTVSANDRFYKAEFSIGSASLKILGSLCRGVGILAFVVVLLLGVA
jgi:hypothetical protein